jgi:hypothetical protein
VNKEKLKQTLAVLVGQASEKIQEHDDNVPGAVVLGVVRVPEKYGDQTRIELYGAIHPNLQMSEGEAFSEVGSACFERTGMMRKIRDVKGVRLKDGREWLENTKHKFVMYDEGVQEEDDSGATLFGWDEIVDVVVSDEEFVSEEDNEDERPVVSVVTVLVSDSPEASDVLASVFGLSSVQLRDLVQERGIRHGKWNGNIYVRVDDVRNALDGRT